MKRMYRVLAALIGLRLALALLGGPAAPAALAQENPTPTPVAVEGSPDPTPGAPGTFTDRVCEGQDALIFQGTDESGAGVSASVEDDWNCLENAPMLVIGPWGGTLPPNAHSACLAMGREEVAGMSDRTGWVNGSVWRLRDDNIVFNHPLVIRCEAVTSEGLATMGLNPHDSHLVPEYYLWVFSRAEELLSPAARTSYCVDHAEEGLSRNILCAEWFAEFQHKVEMFSTP